jgi:hypothetical protein
VLGRHPLISSVVAVVVLAGGMAAATLATLDEELPPPGCPDRTLGCFELRSGEAVQVGLLATTSGPDGREGVEAVQAAHLVVEGSGPILGRPVRLVARDDRCELPAALAAARELASDPPARPPTVAVVGAVCPGTTSPVTQLLSDVGMSLLSWSDDEVTFRDPPHPLFVQVPQVPGDGLARTRFEARFAARFGDTPGGDDAWPAFRATELAVEAIRRVAVDGPGDTVLVPQGPLFELLRRLLHEAG